MRSNIPLELRALPQWVCSGADKVPVNPRTGQHASVTDPSTWSTFEEACRTGAPYVGFVLTESDPYTIIDLDDKPDRPATPEQLSVHVKILEACNTYTERSASGRGYHVVTRGRVPVALHRDGVEVYTSQRYMICTGNVVRNTPICDCQQLLDTLTREMTPAPEASLNEVEEVLEDCEIFDMAINASNGGKFDELCRGDWQAMGYPSQSEADFALLSILTFYSRSNEQVRRLFRMSALGRREKASADNRYLDRALRKIRARQPQDVDLSALLAQSGPSGDPVREQGSGVGTGVQAPCPVAPSPAPTVSTPPTTSTVSAPPGLVGEVAGYIYATAIRPVPEVALCAAIGLVAGIAGRSYNISGSGLNQYLVLLAKTGSGKDGAAAGIDRLLAAVRRTVPMTDQFIGPGVFASGQALLKVLSDRPCFVSILGEFGFTLRQLCDPRANSATLMLKRVLLDIYSKSGANSLLRASVYSDQDKNTKTVQAPNVTILGESTPEAFYEGLNSGHIAEGLIPRFSIVEYKGPRPPRNPRTSDPPSPGLVDKLATLAATALTMAQNNTYANVPLDPPSEKLLADFDHMADAAINGAGNDVEMQLWNRAHLKALKLAAVVAVGVNPTNPVVTADVASWAVEFVRSEIAGVAERFKQGDIGNGDVRTEYDVRRAVEDYLAMDYPKRLSYKVGKGAANKPVVPYTFLRRRLRHVAAFYTDRRGAAVAIKAAIQDAVEAEILAKLSPVQLRELGVSGEHYAKGAAW